MSLRRQLTFTPFPFADTTRLIEPGGLPVSSIGPVTGPPPRA